jgi:sugar phosphate isomerase/epimerase
MQRRSFLKTSSLLLAGSGGIKAIPAGSKKGDQEFGCNLALNAYSFNTPLLEGAMTLEDLFRFARRTGFNGVDLTAYYIQGYPEVPEDKVLYRIRQQAFKLGLAITGTGVRNDFTVSGPGELERQVQLVREWVVAAVKLGAPHVRVFAGRGPEIEEPRGSVKSRIIEALQECAGYAARYGVMIAFQNHNDYIRSTKEILEILEAIDSEWFGLMLDIGSVEGPDPYAGIDRLIPHAITWQVKEQVQSESGTEPTDFNRLMKLVRDHSYQGYFPLETLGEGDPYKKVQTLYDQVSGLLG